MLSVVGTKYRDSYNNVFKQLATFTLFNVLENYLPSAKYFLVKYKYFDISQGLYAVIKSHKSDI